MTKLTHRNKYLMLWKLLNNFFVLLFTETLLYYMNSHSQLYNSWIITEDSAVILSDTLLNPWEILHRYNDMLCAHESSWEKIMLNNYKCRTYSRLKNKLLPYLTLLLLKKKTQKTNYEKSQPQISKKKIKAKTQIKQKATVASAEQLVFFAFAVCLMRPHRIMDALRAGGVRTHC